MRLRKQSERLRTATRGMLKTFGLERQDEIDELDVEALSRNSLGRKGANILGKEKKEDVNKLWRG